MKRRVVVTGMGGLCPIGNSVPEMWANAKKGVCGVAPITYFDTASHKVKLAGEVKNLVVEDYIDKREVRKLSRFTQLALIASNEAVKSSGIDFSQEDTSRCGVNVSSGIGGIGTIEEEHCRGIEKGFDRVSPFFIPMAISNMAAGTIAIAHGLRGSCTSVVTACASGTNSVGEGFRLIRDGYAEIMLCGGTESSITPLGIGGFTSLRALCESTDPTRASIPFDKERSGFVMGEGAGVLFLEEYEHAVKRGATILGEIVGYGTTCDAHHMTAPLEDGSGAAACMTAALADANVAKEQVIYINAHGTSTPMNDRCETAAVKLALGDHANKVLMSSTKGMTGHLLGAAGAIEAILSIMALKDSFAPPTIGYKVPDESCDLNIVPNNGQSFVGDYALSNSLGFGGHNATLLFKRV